MKGELIIVCKQHRRRCELEPAGVDGGTQVRIRHRTGITGHAGDLCVGCQQYIVRREYTFTRDMVLDLAGEFAGK